MPDSLSIINLKYRPKPYYYKLRVPAEYQTEFLTLANRLVPYYKNLIDDIITEAGGKIKCPMDTEYITNYLSGYTINYESFYDSAGEKPKDGYFEVADLENGVFTVFYNTYYPPKRQHATKIHETFHIMQLIDLEFRKFVDNLIFETELPSDVIELLLERVSEKATFMYLMPNDYFIKKYQEVSDIKILSDYFEVSEESVFYRLKELGLVYAR